MLKYLSVCSGIEAVSEEIEYPCKYSERRKKVIKVFPKKGYKKGDMENIIQCILANNCQYAEIKEFPLLNEEIQLSMLGV